jgi:hypothetical protein
MDFTSTTTYPTKAYDASETDVLDFANAVRRAGGGNIIGALTPSTPGESDACLIANAHNFGGEIRPLANAVTPARDTLRGRIGQRISEFDAPGGIWSMGITDHEAAVSIGEALNLPVWVPDPDSAELAEIALPACFTRIAETFDYWEGEFFETRGQYEAAVSEDPKSWVRLWINGIAEEDFYYPDFAAA